MILWGWVIQGFLVRNGHGGNPACYLGLAVKVSSITSTHSALCVRTFISRSLENCVLELYVLELSVNTYFKLNR